MSFKAIQINKTDAGQTVGIVELNDSDLMEGDVTVRVTHSTMNYKDGLAITGKSPVVRRFPMIPGVDFAGVVERSDNPAFKAGDAVILNGWGCGETHLGGYAQKARVKGDWLVPMPQGLHAAQAMAIGTAGYTAMLCVMALERFGLTPDQGAVVVTGAVGGVGSVSVAVLAKLGWHVVAVTGRPEEADYLKSLGASEIVERKDLSGPGRPLAKERWIAGVDSVGSHTLANVLAATKYGGAIAACGLAQGLDLPATVAPFILRNVALLGVESVMCPKAKRIAAWNRLVQDLDLTKLATITHEIAFEDIIPTAQALLDGKVRGRVVVAV